MKKDAKDRKFDKFLKLLVEEYEVFAPQKSDGGLFVREVADVADIELTDNMPVNNWKRLLFADGEKVVDFKNGAVSEATPPICKIAALGVNVIDLRAITLFEHVFANYHYYQKKRANMLIVGYSDSWPIDYKKYKAFSHDFEKNVLEHLMFDVFVCRNAKGAFDFYTGSRAGQKFLEKCGIMDYYNIVYAGSSPKTPLDRKMLKLQDKVAKSFNKKVWNELGKICLACGKCSIACPTCYCFDLEDKSDPAVSGRVRKWGNCFYNDFSRQAGGAKPLDEVKEKIYFWYVHKFVRIPREYGMPGCVSCGRCSKVCPVGIKINEVLKRI